MSVKSDSKSDVVVKLPISSLRDFSCHPYKVRDDESMRETAESVKAFRVLVPIIVRPCDAGGYEIISGHRRKRACELADIDTMPAIVRELDDDAATIVMVDSNLQRENVLPSERAQAYKMKLEVSREVLIVLPYMPLCSPFTSRPLSGSVALLQPCVAFLFSFRPASFWRNCHFVSLPY